MTLDDIQNTLTVISQHPCHCDNCQQRKQQALLALMDVSPSGKDLLTLDREAPGFQEIEQRFRKDELKRLERELAKILKTPCLMARVAKPTAPPQDLPQETGDERMRRYAAEYRRQARNQRMRIEPLEGGIPGAFIIK